MTGPTLTAPFRNAKHLNKGGTTLTYIPASEVIDRLNAVLGVGEWRFAVELEHADSDFIVVKGRLTACGGLYEQYGGQVINKKRDGSVLDLGDDYKGAASDALKKCAQMIGVGLYLALEHEPLSAKTAGDAPQGAAQTESPVSLPDDVVPQRLSSGSSAGDAETPSAVPLPAEDQSRGGGVLGEVDATPAGDLVDRATLLITSLKGKSTKEWLGYRRNQSLPLSVKEYGEKQLADAVDFLEGLHAEQVPA